MDDTAEKADATQPQTEPARRGGGFSWLLWFFIFILVYVLSFGPATKIYHNYPALRPAVEAVYKPLTLLSDNCRPVRRFFGWYADTVWKVWKAK